MPELKLSLSYLMMHVANRNSYSCFANAGMTVVTHLKKERVMFVML